MFVCLDACGRVTLANRKACSVLGVTSAEILGKDWFDHFLPGSIRGEVKEVYRRLMDGEVAPVEFFDNAVLTRSGDERLISWHNTLLLDSAGTIVGTLSSGEDVTDRRRAEAALLESESRFRGFFDNAPIGKSMTAPNGRLLRVNPAFCRMLGYTPEEMARLTFAEITHPDDLAESRECVRSLLAGEKDAWTMDKRYVARDGRAVWTTVTTRLQRGADGSPLFFLTHVLDITERRRAEAEAAAWRQRFELATAASGQVAYQCDTATGAILWSGAVEQVFGFRPEELLGGYAQWESLIHPEDRAGALRILSEAEASRVPYDAEYRFRHKAGHYLRIRDRGFFAPDTGSPTAIVGMMTDVTAQWETAHALRASEAKYRTIYENAQTGIFRTSVDGARFIDFNPRLASILGYPREELAGLAPAAIWAEPAARDHMIDSLRQTDRLDDYEVVIRRKDGGLRTCQVTIVLNRAGGFLEGTAVDVTNRVEAEARARFLADLVENSDQPIGTGYPDGRLGICNRAFCELTGYREDELRSVSWSDVLTPPEWLDAERTALAELERTGQPARYRKEYIRKDGHRVPVELFVHAVRDPAGRVEQYYAFVTDITERKRQESIAQARLAIHEFAGSHSLEELLRKTLDEIALLTGSPIGFYHFVGPDQKTLSLQAWSTRTEREFCRAEGKGQHYGIDEAGVWVDCVREGRPVIHNDYASLPHRKGLPPGHAPVIRELVVPVRRQDRLVAIVGVGNKPKDYTQADLDLVAHLADVTWEIVERKRAEATLRESEERIHHLYSVLLAIRNVNQLIVREQDPATLIAGACRLLVETRGYRSAWIARLDGNRNLAGFAESGLGGVAADLRERLERGNAPSCLRRALEAAEVVSILDPASVCGDCPVVQAHRVASALSARLEHAGRTYGVLVAMLPRDYVADAEERSLFQEMASDIAYALAGMENEARRRQAEAQLQQSQRLESVGRLAGGVAHEFNNLLLVILGRAELIALRCPEGDPRRRDIDQIRQAGERATAVTRQLLAFSRRQEERPRVIDLGAVVRDEEHLLHSLIGEDIDVIVSIDPATGHVRADPGHVAQILLNLSVNARDAMPQGGRLRIATSRLEVAAGDARALGGLAPGPYAELTVADTGCGVDEATRSRLFEPFFTTKAPGRGTGLGLSIVYGIVTKAGGRIEVESTPGQGSLFRILLPRLEPSPEACAAAAPSSLPPPRGRRETLLVVEDEADLRELVVTWLRDGGYEVLEAASGEEALRLDAERLARVRLLLTDVVLTGMSGHDLASRLTGSHPPLRVVYMSGYEGTPVPAAAAPPGSHLQKPFTGDDLLRAVREALDRATL